MKIYRTPSVQIVSLSCEDVLTFSYQRSIDLDALNDRGGDYSEGMWTNY